ncbi:intercompartmental signaling factor BofC [Evansella clarkii]|uniref:intercompartmental signaling factor BofC n=1 Tax=Evansella clarkii TaxID=79879 RepID=UPI000B45235D|nr:intercompartmental signaling factor BofC [Evansella clarkii]
MLLFKRAAKTGNCSVFLISSYLFLVFSIVILYSAFPGVTMAEKLEAADYNAKTIEVILQREYLDGEISEERVEETIWSVEDFWALYEDWQLIDQNEDQIVFRMALNDISPLLKINGYFGLSEDGTLSIYNGKPDANEVIQSFFQVNTSRLKSHHYESLRDGIPVSSKDDYLEVLKTYEEYAIREL